MYSKMFIQHIEIVYFGEEGNSNVDNWNKIKKKRKLGYTCIDSSLVVAVLLLSHPCSTLFWSTDNGYMT